MSAKEEPVLIEVHENYVPTEQSIMTQLIEIRKEISALSKRISDLTTKIEQLPPPIPLATPTIPPTMSNTYSVLRARNFHLRRGDPMPFVADHS